MTREDVIEALKNNEDGLERDINWFLDSIDYLNWKNKHRTITVNDFEVPEPLRVEPMEGDKVWIIRTGWCMEESYSSNIDLEAFKNGAIHLTQEAAQAHYDALWAPSRLK